jgi:hypothetical protein
MLKKRLACDLAEQSLLSSVMTLNGDVQTRVTGLLRGICKVLAHHGAPKRVLDSALKQFVEFLSVDSEGLFLKKAKYLLAMFMARYLRNPEPKTDESFVSHGPWKRWARPRLIEYSRKNTHLWMSFMQCKRSALPLSPDIVFETYLKHRTQMAKPDPLQSDDLMYDRIIELLQPILRKIKRGLERYSDSALRDVDHAASTSAAWDSNRSVGGQAGMLSQRLFTNDFTRPLPAALSQSVDQLISMDYTVEAKPVTVRYGKASRKHQLRPVKIPISSVELNKVEQRGDPDRIAEFSEKIGVWARTDVLRYAGRLPAMIQAVLEPLKVRVISKGLAAPYYYSKGLQKALHTTMRNMPCFRLIGRPVSPTDLYDLYRPGAEYWYSGDYEASTDNLSARLGNGLLRLLVDELDDWDNDVYRAVLAPHTIHYPPVSVKDQNGHESLQSIEPIDQVNGQLMGSILSFPILCLANLGLYLSTVFHEQTPTDREIFEACDKVLVNGDDILYRASEAECERHELNGARVGLKMSVGKTYKHKRYANVNSTSFDYAMPADGSLFGRNRSCPVQIDFLNTGLFFGQSKVLTTPTTRIERIGVDMSSDEALVSPHCVVVDALLQGALPGRQVDVLSDYLRVHGAAIRHEARGRNLFASRSFGGFGMHAPCGWRTADSFTPLQRKLAAAIYRLSPDAVVNVRPYDTRIIGSTEISDEAWATMAGEAEDGSLFSFLQTAHQNTLARFRPIDSDLLQIGFVVGVPGNFTRE